MFARVIVGINTESLDRIFDYEIGDEWLDVCKKGVRVLVPFGFRNKKTEGYVLGVSDKASDGYTGEYKKILKVLDGGNIMFTNETLFLAEFMKKEYFCTLSICLQTIMPSAMKVKTQHFVSVAKNKKPVPIMDNYSKEIYDYLSSKKTGVSINYLKMKFDKKVSDILVMLQELELIYKYEKAVYGEYKNEKTYYSINKDTEDYEKSFEDAKTDKRKAKQLEVFEVFEENKAEDMLSLDFLKEKNISVSSLNTLEKNGVLNKHKIEERRKVYSRDDYDKSIAFTPTEEQETALNHIYKTMNEDVEKKPVLLHGITGSGKTEIYLQAIEENIKNGKQAIILVPEISLTPQIMNQFISRFGERVSVTHSRLSDGERVDQWRKARDGEIDIMIGPRSALFTPFSNLGIIIIDEIHETTYISDTTPKYDAREVAIALTKITNSLLIMGSATPNIEFYHRGLSGEFDILTLEKRAGGGEIPKVNLIDMRFELANGNRSPFSYELQQAIRETLARKEQIMLFLNRRGYTTFVNCRSCGMVMECPECELPYTYHNKLDELMCHHCGKKEVTPKTCPDCQSKYIRHFGMGTQKIEEEAINLFPDANILRMDFDTTKGKNTFQSILEQFRSGNGDILIGTQMIAKGHDFPNVTLMGIMAGDASLYTGGFYGAENTFQLITQSAGRAGRAKSGGKVYLQAYNPDHYAIKHSKNQDYNGFYKEESAFRKLMGYPPFGIFFSVVIFHKEDGIAEDTANKLYKEMKSVNDSDGKKFTIMNVVTTRRRKIDGDYGYRILIQSRKIKSRVDLVDFVVSCVEVIKKGAKKDVYFNLTADPRYIV